MIKRVQIYIHSAVPMTFSERILYPYIHVSSLYMDTWIVPCTKRVEIGYQQSYIIGNNSVYTVLYTVEWTVGA